MKVIILSLSNALSWRMGLVFISLALLGGCGSKVPQLPPLSPDATVLAFGDSLTYGTGASLEGSYPAVLEALIGHPVINAGVPGELSAQGVARLSALLDEHQPELLLLCHGGNDLLQRSDELQIVENLRAMIQQAHHRQISVVLIGVPEPGMFLGSANFYRRTAQVLKLPYESRILSKILSDANLKSDPVHPNAAGYREMAQALAELLRQTGALPAAIKP